MKKIISVLLTIIIIVSLFNMNTLCVSGEIGHFVSLSKYVGSYSSDSPMEFSIDSVNYTNNTFTGWLKIDDLIVNPNQSVSGNISYNNDNYICSFSLNNYYPFSLTIHPFTGVVTGIGGGGWLFYSYDIHLEGPINPCYNKPYSYNDEDMRMCMDFSDSIYENKSSKYKKTKHWKCEEYNDFSAPKELLTSFGGYDGVVDGADEVLSTNFSDDNKDNVAFTVCRRENDFNNDDVVDSVDIIVVIRGTLDEEWQGNTEITGESYISSKQEHDNFYKAKDSIKEGIQTYYEDLTQNKGYNPNQVNLIITGHSRGAAVANIYAKEATDNIISTTPDDEIPVFNNVTAYTFACPNVRQYYAGMENYINIFNFRFDEDIVPTVPLTLPKNGWGYWKFGRVYTTSLYDVLPQTGNSLSYSVNRALINKYAPNEINTAFLYWGSVEKYYNKQINHVSFNNNGIPYFDGTTSSVYNILHNLTEKFKSKKFKGNRNVLNTLKDNVVEYPELSPLVLAITRNLPSIGLSHWNTTYNIVINTLDYGINNFDEITYNDVNYISPLRSQQQRSNRDITYNPTEVDKLQVFANSNNNNDILEWDLSDPSSWTGITWDNNGNVTEIDFSYKWLSGSLNLAGFTSLTKLNIYANMITALNISGDTALLSLDCSYNNLSQNGLTVRDCTDLTKLYCDGCSLSHLDTTHLSGLEELSCSFNYLTSMALDNNTELTRLVCCYNYLEIYDGSNIKAKLNTLQNNGCYVNSYPQSVPENAVFNSTELSILRAFALAGDNNDALDWLDENDNIDTEKLQNNVLFEYDGSQYRGAVIDIADLEISGELDLDSFSKLSEFYCENTDITALDLSDCTSLEILSCYNCEIETFGLPSNILNSNSPLYQIDCEYNHIDTSIFTQSIIDSIEAKTDYVLEYENQKWEDDSALAAALEFAGTLKAEDYSENSFSYLTELVEEYSDYENMLLTQDDVNEMTSDLLTAVCDLVPYLKLKTSCENGTVSITKDGEPVSGTKLSALSGTNITLSATPNEGYIFNGWYEKRSKRVFSTDSSYSFKLTTNLSFEAQFVPNGSATLTFTNDTGQIVDKVTKTALEWANTSSISDLLPAVPYKLGHTSGQWAYIESDVLTSLSNGTDAVISPAYSPSEYVYPEIPQPIDGKPVLNLTYTYNDTEDIASFIMAAGIPENLEIKAVGVAFYRNLKERFNPNKYELNLNNKLLVSRFDGRESDGIYIVNVHKFAVKYNWCARGFITYESGNKLITRYTNQINVENQMHNGVRMLIPRSIVFPDDEEIIGIDTDIDNEDI